LKKIVYCLFTVFASAVQIPGDKEVTKAVGLFYNYDTRVAVQILTEARNIYPENPRVHFTWAAARMLENEAHKPVVESYKILENDLNEIIPILKRLSEVYSDIPDYQLYLGSATGLKARIYLGKKEWIPTLINAYKGFRIIQKIEKKHPNLIDAKLPIGIVEYFAGLSPGFIQLTAKLFGLKAKGQVGLKKMNQAVLKGEFSHIEAKKILSFLNLWVEKDFNAALRYSRELNQEFPNNYFFSIMYLESLIKTGNREDSKRLIEQLTEELTSLTPIQQNWYESYLVYEKSLFYFLNSEFDKALHHVNYSIDNYHAELDIILSHAHLLKGKIHDIKNEREKALQSYKKCIKLDNYSSAITEAETYLKNRYILQ